MRSEEVIPITPEELAQYPGQPWQDRCAIIHLWSDDGSRCVRCGAEQKVQTGQAA